VKDPIDERIERYSLLPVTELVLMFSASARVLVDCGALTTADLKDALDAAEEVKGEPI
jgi:hypothetical protein